MRWSIPFGHRTVRAGMLGILVVVGSLATGSSAESFREQVEADWRRQDECRLAEIREASLVRFVETELSWPGIKRDGRLRVPKLSAPTLDGRLDDACWRQALHIEPKTPDGAKLLLSHDGQRFYVAATLPTRAEIGYRGDPTALDAAGAVNGVKDGIYSFHTNSEPNPWWQVDLGKPQSIDRIVIYNRLDYAPGLHNADNLLILTSLDGKNWTRAYDNRGEHFGGATDGKPLVVRREKLEPNDDAGPAAARFVRLQIRSDQPIFLHLDEVEVYGTADPSKNVAVNRPASQSSLSRWSRGLSTKGALFTLGGLKCRFAAEEKNGLILNQTPLAADVAAIGREAGQTHVEIALPWDQAVQQLAAGLQTSDAAPIPLAIGSNWQLAWPEDRPLGFGKNLISIELKAQGPLESPVRLVVESIVFTSQRPQRRVVVDRELTAGGTIPLEFQIVHEGAAAVIVSARQGKAEYSEGRCFFVGPVAQTLDRARRLLFDFEMPEPDRFELLTDRARALSDREKAEGADPETRQSLLRDVRWLARGIALTNLKRTSDEIILVKRFTQQAYPDVCLNHMPWVSRPGGDICVATLKGPDEACEVRNLLDGALGPGHVHGMDLWWDADRVVFGYAMAKSDEPPAGWLNRNTSYELRRNEEPTHIFEIGTDSSGLRQLTSGEWSDLDPTYLADGQIAFVSERCECSLQCNEYNKDETSCNLYAMTSDGDRIRRLSVTKDGDYLPHSLDDGTIAYTRWEYQERSWAHVQSVWTIRPDGTGADALYKQHMNDPWALEDMRSIPGSKKLVAIATGHHTLAAGPVVIIDPHQGMNDPAGIRIVTPGVDPPEGGMTGTPVASGGVPGRGGFYMTPWALSEKSFLVSYTYGPETDPAGYAIYLIDTYGTKELIYRDPEISCSVPIPLRRRQQPPILADATDPSVPHATCMVANAAYGVQGVVPESVKYIRISQRLQWPYTNEFGGERYEPDVKRVMVNWTPARVIGEVPVEADGSAHFIVPVDTPVYFQLLDENHMELRRMRSFISFQPGENRGCVGCHETRGEAPPVIDDHRFPLALLRDPSVPKPPPWGDAPISFLRDVQPVFDRHCTGCHGGLKPAGDLDFSAGLTASNNRAYDTILTAGLVSRSNVGDDAKITPPLAFGSHRSKLVEVLRGGPCSSRASLSDEDWLRLVTWIDANGPYHDGFINKRLAQPPYDLPNDRELAGKIEAVHARRCGSCHAAGEVTRLDWIDLARPSQSLFLTAPLAKDATSKSRCPQPVYKDPADPDYQTVSRLVTDAVTRAWQYPRRDLKALVPASSVDGVARTK